MPCGMKKDWKGKLKENGSLRGHMDFSQLLNDTKFQGYASLTPKATMAAQLSASF